METVVVVSKEFYPSNSTRANQAVALVKELSSNYNVIVVSEGLKDGEKELGFDNTELVRVRSLFSGNKLLTKINNYLYPILGFIWARRVNAALLTKRFEYLITLSSPIDSHLVSKKELGEGCIWFAFFSDPYPYSILPYPYKKKYIIFSFLQERLVKSILNKCDYALYTNDNAIGYVESNLDILIKHKSHSLPHFTIGSKSKKLNEPKIVKRELLHAGHLTKERISYDFFKAFSLLVAEKEFEDVVFTFVGKCDEKIYLMVKELGIESNVKYIREISYEKAICRCSKAMGVVIIEADMLDSPFIPSKVADSKNINRPVLAVINKNNSIDKQFSENGFLQKIYHEQTVGSMKESIKRFVGFAEDAELNYECFDKYYNNSTIVKILQNANSKG